MILLAFLLKSTISDQIQEFTNSEAPQLFVFNSQETLQVRYFQTSGYSLVILSDTNTLTLKDQGLDGKQKDVNLGEPKDKGTYYVYNQQKFDENAHLLNFKCSSKIGTCTVSLAVVQSVTSLPVLRILGIASIIMVWAIIIIIFYQFFTFHRIKRD